MNARKFLSVMRSYSDCPDCGNDKLGNGEGTLNVDDDVFVRTCKCGFKVEIHENEIN